MKINDLLKSGQFTFSFEFFPPKTPEGEKAFLTIAELKKLNPHFVSVTYGAMGNTRQKTIQIVSKIKHELEIEPMAHLTCVGHSHFEIKEILLEMKKNDIENIMALRGDPPKGEVKFVKPQDGFEHGDELIQYIGELDQGFCVGGAAYPEGHVESPDRSNDYHYAKSKQQAGAKLLITQLFFENQHYFDYIEKIRNIGVTVPVIPGIMPVTQYSQVERFIKMSGCQFPKDFLEKLNRVKDNPDQVEKIGLEFTIKQCRSLIEKKVPGLHFYTLNQSKTTQKIVQTLKTQL